MVCNGSEWPSVLQGAVAKLMQDPGGQEAHSKILISRQRHRVLLGECQAALVRYMDVQDQHELAAEELRHAAHALGKLSGKIDPEAVLDVLFTEFCIGK
jgi:tRNA modification GTPase